MAISPIPANELTRLKGLRELMLLDTPAEALFDTLARKAAEVCNTPIALVSLVDSDRQWFKANVGLTGVTETARNVAFCAHAIMNDHLLVVHDATSDERFSDNPLVKGQPNIRFYAGCPLALPDGSKVGTLCVIDQVARKLSTEQLETLQFLSSLVTQALLMRKELLSKALQVRTEYEQALEQNEERFRALVETQTDLVSLASRDGTLHYVNPAYARHFGLTPVEMLGRNIFEFVAEHDIPVVSTQIERVFETRETQHGENRMWGADGTEKWVAWSNHIQQDASGETLLHSVGRDISDIRRAEQALKTSERLLEHMASIAKVGGWELDLQTQIVTWTLETKKIHDVSSEFEPSLESAVSFYPASVRPMLEESIREAVRNGSSWDLELPLTTANGRGIWVRACGEVEYGESGQAIKLFGTVQDVTERKALEAELQMMSQEYRDLYDHAPCGYCSLDEQGFFTRINQVALSWLECRSEDVVGRLGLIDFLDDAEKVRFAESYSEFLSDGRFGPIEFNLLGHNGQERRVSLIATSVKDEVGKFILARTVLYDVTELFAIRQQLHRLNLEQEAMLDNDMLGIAKLKDRRIIWRNRALERIFGYEPGGLLGQPTAILYPNVESYEAFGSEAYPLLTNGQSFRRQWKMKRGNGDPIWIDVNGMSLTDTEGETLWLLQDISEMRQYQEQVEHIAFHDNLTKLPNRLLLSDRMRQAIAFNDRMGTIAAICYLDLDGFKPVNDQYGHEVGDRLLQEIAKRLLATVRATDTVARLGGDEFVLLLTGLQQPVEAEEILGRAKIVIEQPWTSSEGKTVQVSASFGLAFHPRDGSQPSQLLKIADDGMYLAKRSGKILLGDKSWSPEI